MRTDEERLFNEWNRNWHGPSPTPPKPGGDSAGSPINHGSISAGLRYCDLPTFTTYKTQSKRNEHLTCDFTRVRNAPRRSITSVEWFCTCQPKSLSLTGPASSFLRAHLIHNQKSSSNCRLKHCSRISEIRNIKSVMLGLRFCFKQVRLSFFWWFAGQKCAHNPQRGYTRARTRATMGYSTQLSP